MEKSTLAHIAHFLPYKAVGGTEHATLRLATAARAAGFQNSIFVLPDCAEIAEFFRAQNFEVFEYPEIEPSLTRPRNYWRDSSKLANKISSLKPDLLHCADWGAAMMISLAGLRSARPIVSHVRNRHSKISRRDQFFLKSIKHWLFVSKNTRENFGCRIADEKTTVFYDGIEIAEVDETIKREHRISVCEEFGIEPDTKIIGTLARVAPQKDFFTLGKAVKQIVEKTDKIRVLVVGSTSHEEEHRRHFAEVSQFLNEVGVSKYCIFTDFRRDTIRFLHSFDVFVLSTHFEGFPLVNLEAMAQKIPVIATDVDGIAEAVVDGKSGLLFEHENSAKLAENLERLLSDSDYARTLGAAGFEFVKANFSREKFAENTVNFYRWLLKLN